MRRELRRHPVEGKPTRGTNRPTRASQRAAAVRATPGATAPGKRVRGLPAVFQPAWMGEVLQELRKVQWPSRQDTINLTLVVVIVAAALGLFLGGIDAAFNWILENTLLS